MSSAHKIFNVIKCAIYCTVIILSIIMSREEIINLKFAKNLNRTTQDVRSGGADARSCSLRTAHKPGHIGLRHRAGRHLQQLLFSFYYHSREILDWQSHGTGACRVVLLGIFLIRVDLIGLIPGLKPFQVVQLCPYSVDFVSDDPFLQQLNVVPVKSHDTDSNTRTSLVSMVLPTQPPRPSKQPGSKSPKAGTHKPKSKSRPSPKGKSRARRMAKHPKVGKESR